MNMSSRLGLLIGYRTEEDSMTFIAHWYVAYARDRGDPIRELTLTGVRDHGYGQEDLTAMCNNPEAYLVDIGIVHSEPDPQKYQEVYFQVTFISQNNDSRYEFWCRGARLSTRYYTPKEIADIEREQAREL
ncbi:MAG: hypothetical protein LBV45_08595 [Xanthomonadaceae bacterium]|jgi:hypothetical protein|nr:hypothetical protein [Xanthomonadaceae bacterium]